MIVKLKSRKVRTNIYKKRKGQQSVKVYLELTMGRLNLKKLAIEKKQIIVNMLRLCLQILTVG